MQNFSRVSMGAESWMYNSISWLISQPKLFIYSFSSGLQNWTFFPSLSCYSTTPRGRDGGQLALGEGWLGSTWSAYVLVGKNMDRPMTWSGFCECTMPAYCAHVAQSGAPPLLSRLYAGVPMSGHASCDWCWGEGADNHACILLSIKNTLRIQNKKLPQKVTTVLRLQQARTRGQLVNYRTDSGQEVRNRRTSLLLLLTNTAEVPPTTTTTKYRGRSAYYYYYRIPQKIRLLLLLPSLPR
jgi:hypothetical protein